MPIDFTHWQPTLNVYEIQFHSVEFKHIIYQNIKNLNDVNI